MTTKRRNMLRAAIAALSALVLLGVDLDVDIALNPLFGLLG
jgi:hypothetical protein